MNKYTQYDSRIIESILIDKKVYASMTNILNNILPGAWDDYQQILNSENNLMEDLGVLHLPDDCITDVHSTGYFIPITNVSRWLYTINIKASKESLQNRFRMYRRDCENSLRVTWSMEAEDLIINKIDWITPDLDQYNLRHSEYSEMFRIYGIPIIPSVINNGRILDLIYEAAASDKAGPYGKNLVKTIDYISDLPLSDMMLDYIDDCISSGKLECVDIDSMFSNIDTTASFLVTHFIGEKNAK